MAWCWRQKPMAWCWRQKPKAMIATDCFAQRTPPILPYIRISWSFSKDHCTYRLHSNYVFAECLVTDPAIFYKDLPVTFRKGSLNHLVRCVIRNVQLCPGSVFPGNQIIHSKACRLWLDPQIPDPFKSLCCFVTQSGHLFAKPDQPLIKTYQLFIFISPLPVQTVQFYGQVKAVFLPVLGPANSSPDNRNRLPWQVI